MTEKEEKTPVESLETEQPLQDKDTSEDVIPGETWRQFQAQKDREVSEANRGRDSLNLELEQVRSELTNLQQRTTKQDEPRFSPNYTERANQIWVQSQVLYRERQLPEEKLKEIQYLLSDKNLPAAKIILRNARERESKIEDEANERARSIMEKAGLLKTDTGGPSGSSATFENTEAAWIAGKVDVHEYAKARKRKKLK